METETFQKRPEDEQEVDYRALVKRAIANRRQALVFELARRLHKSMRETVRIETRGERETQQWVCIESLSQLRASVGGRFQNLKQRWVAAGFPLREHRGDRSEEAVINRDGWLELSAWIAKQGFESRLLPEEEVGLFEVRPLEASIAD